MIDICAEIVPNESLGNIKLRGKIDNVLNILKRNEIIYYVSNEKKNDTRVLLYSIFNDCIIISIDNLNSKIFRITAKNGYEGKLLNKFKVGDTLHDVYKSEESFYFSERDETVLSDKYPGVSLDIEEFDYSFHILKSPKVENISVFAVESMTPQGQSGNW